MTAGGYARATYGEVADRVDRLGRVLERLGVERGDRVATFAWNSQRHFELYLAVPCFGAVLHTLNIRLFPEQISYIVGHADDQVIFVDGSLVEPLAKLVAGSDRFGGVRHYVVMGDGDLDALPGALSYEQLLEEAGAGELRLARRARARGGGAVLHERDDRQPQGRALLAPLGGAALDRAVPVPTAWRCRRPTAC